MYSYPSVLSPNNSHLQIRTLCTSCHPYYYIKIFCHVSQSAQELRTKFLQHVF